MKTRRLFREVIDKVEITFQYDAEYSGARRERTEIPLKVSEGGGPVMYSRIKLSAAIIVKGMRSFVNLPAELSNVRYDMTLNGSERYPPSERHNIFA